MKKWVFDKGERLQKGYLIRTDGALESVSSIEHKR